MPKRSDIVLQINYTPNGHAATDMIQLGAKWAKSEPTMQAITVNVMSATCVTHPLESRHQVVASAVLSEKTKIISFMPHMHL